MTSSDVFTKEFQLTGKDVVLNEMTNEIIVFCKKNEIETLKASLPLEWSSVRGIHKINVLEEYKTPKTPRILSLPLAPRKMSL